VEDKKKKIVGDSDGRVEQLLATIQEWARGMSSVLGTSHGRSVNATRKAHRRVRRVDERRSLSSKDKLGMCGLKRTMLGDGSTGGRTLRGIRIPYVRNTEAKKSQETTQGNRI